MSGHQPESSDTSAAFAGLIFGAIFIGAILYGIVMIVNKKFENEKGAEGKKAAVTVLTGVLVS